MSLTFLIIIIITIGSLLAGLLLLKQSAKKFHLSQKQLQQIKSREKEQLKKDKDC